MAARPVQQRVNHSIARDGGEEYIFARIRAGDSPEDIMRDYGVSPRLFYFWLDEEDGRRHRYAVAQQDSADAHVTKAGTLLAGKDPETGEELVVVTGGDAALIKARAEHHRWVASRLNRAKYGQQPQTQINIASAGDLHLEALKAWGSPTERDQLPAAEPLDVEEPLEAETEQLADHAILPEPADDPVESSHATSPDSEDWSAVLTDLRDASSKPNGSK